MAAKSEDHRQARLTLTEIVGSSLAKVNSRPRSLYAIARPSICRPLVRPTQAVVIFGNFSTAFGTLAIR